MSSMILYTNPMSRGRIIRWMLEEIGVPCELRVMEFGDTMKTPEYLALNPMGKVPTLVDDGAVVTEVVAICAYLAERFPEAALAPPLGSSARAAYWRWLFFIAGPLEMAMTAKQYQWRIDTENSMSVGCGMTDDALHAIEQQLHKGPWLCGDSFTVPDLLLSSYLGWYLRWDMLESRPVYVDYVARAEARAAAQRATALDDALIKP